MCKQIADRKNFLPRGTKFIAIPDRDGRRVGSGGATLEVLRYLHEQEGSFDSLDLVTKYIKYRLYRGTL